MQNILLVLCFAAGALLAWLVLRERLAARDRELAAAAAALASRDVRLAALEQSLAGRTASEAALRAQLDAERRSAIEKLALLDDAQRRLADSFKALSADALRDSSHSFLQLARETFDQRHQAIADVVTPVRESLVQIDAKLQSLETTRAGAYAALTEQVRGLAETQTQLRGETGKLINALRTPAVRGHWGEMQLRRVVEMAGMLEHCDFQSQPTATGEDGRLRPDLLVRLPGGKHVVIDAKTPLESYLQAIDAADEPTRKARFTDHARQVRAHVTNLSRKSYWEQFEPAPEFVVLFLPGECFFSAALEHDPSLIETGAERNIILATPTTLIALLRAVSYGWRQEKLARNAAEISRLGRDLYKRLADMALHWTRVGKSLDRAVESYNAAVGSLESRVLTSARRFAELETTPFGVEIEALEPVEKSVRIPQSPEFTAFLPEA